MAYELTSEGWKRVEDFDKYNYHICRIYRGKKAIFIPYIPRHAKENGENYRVKRICVSPTIKQCIQGIDGITHLNYSTLEIGSSWYVYRTEKKGKPAVDICDFDITGECWIKEETKFEYYGRLYRLSEYDFAVYKNKKIIFEFD